MARSETIMTLVVDGTEIPDIRSFSYTSDVRQLADPFACDIPDPQKKWSPYVVEGAPVEVYLQNPEVNSGKKTKKLKGRIRKVKQKSSLGDGRVLQIQGADLGWHLTQTCGPLWFNLQRSTYKKLLEAALDDSWGFAGVRMENDTSRGIKLGRAQKLLYQTPNALLPLQYIGIEPGESVADVLTHVARYAGLLVNVSPDGYLQGWSPNYRREPLYQVQYHPVWSSQADRNNVEDVEVESDADPLYTHVTCVGEVLMEDLTPPPEDPHPGKKRGHYEDTSLLPFAKLLTFVDPEQLDSQMAARHAKWRSMQGQYEAWTYTAQMAQHHQNGTWYEADTLIAIDDDANTDTKTGEAIRGNFYVAAVNLYWDPRRGDRALLTIKRPDLLVPPSFGRDDTPKKAKKKKRQKPEPPTSVSA